MRIQENNSESAVLKYRRRLIMKYEGVIERCSSTREFLKEEYLFILKMICTTSTNTNLDALANACWGLLFDTTPTHAAVFDIDGTVLTSKIQPIQPIIQLYNCLIEKNMPVYIVTARKFSPENLSITRKHLRRVGIKYFHGLILRPAEYQDVATFKATARRSIERQFGVRIVMTCGNEWWDLDVNRENLQQCSDFKHLLCWQNGKVYLKIGNPNPAEKDE